MTDTLHIVVAGATGGTGRLVVERAVLAGHRVTALVRPTTDWSPPPGVAVRRVDVMADHGWDLPEDTDAVISTLGKRSWSDPVPVCAEGIAHLITAMAARDVQRLLAVSAVPVLTTGVGEPWWFRRLVRPAVARFGRALYADLAAMEAEIRSSDTEWTILRPGRLVDASPTEYRLVPEANATTDAHRVDLADALVGLVADPASLRRSYGLARGRLRDPDQSDPEVRPADRPIGTRP